MAIDPNKESTSEFKELVEKYIIATTGQTGEAPQIGDAIHAILSSQITQTATPAEVNSNSSEQSPK